MHGNSKYWIERGTPIVWRDVRQDLKLRPHVVETPLSFDELQCTGDGGSKYYFELGDWLIVVDSSHVEQKAAGVINDGVVQANGVNHLNRESTSLDESERIQSTRFGDAND